MTWLKRIFSQASPPAALSASQPSGRASNSSIPLPIGACDKCGAEFRYRLLHSGFNETIYAYCDPCGLLLLLSTYDPRAAAQRARPDWARAIDQSTEPSLPSCACGGKFTAAAAPRCPKCAHPLDAERARTWIEPQAGANRKTRRLWTWQGNWSGLYCIAVEDRSTQEGPG